MTDPKIEELFVALTDDEFAKVERPSPESIDAALAAGKADRDAALDGMRAPRMDSRLMFR